MNNFDAWYDYHKHHKNWANTPEQLARWAWAEQQLKIDRLENDIEQIAKLLNIDTSIINMIDIRNIIMDTIKTQGSNPKG